MTYPFRLGATSYVVPADILTNVRYLAGKVQDVELVLFEVDDGPNNLPLHEEIEEMRRLAARHDMTYTVHLPLDLRLADDGFPRHASLDKARRVIDCTLALDPWAYVLHLDGKTVLNRSDAESLLRWRDQAVLALELVGKWAGGPQRLAVENLEGYPPDFYDPVLERIAVSRTVDVGHLWLDGYDPVAYLKNALPRTRVIHLHGIEDRDHRSVAKAPREKLKAVLDELVSADYRGVLTLEVFSETDFLTSCAAVKAAMHGDMPSSDRGIAAAGADGRRHRS
ncbi:MAG: sugar phosphate isomerase/epimerase [Smithella sp.]|nr:cobamide remodeling phosphodiesterase CbiR [Smithellaceae bacterium]NLA41131.1 sugar phosphate isomerase/epimerase [Smithella sp.]